jgi:YHS domain-containing protein
MNKKTPLVLLSIVVVASLIVKEEEMFAKVDPVCRVKVSKKTPYVFRCGTKIYYFDCQACRNTFKDNPERFVKGKFGSGLLSGFAKGSGDIPKSCHDIRR